MTVKPFNWGNIKKVSMEEVRLMEELEGLLPAGSAGEDISLGIRRMLIKHLGEKSFFYLDSLATQSFGSFLSSLPEVPVMAVIGTDQGDAKLLAQIDTNLAFLVIDRLLGGSSLPAVESRPLSETEQGVLQYFIMQVLLEIWKACGESARYHFRFDRFAFGSHGVESVYPHKELLAAPVFKVGIGELSGFLKIYIPEPFVKKAAHAGGSAGRSGENRHLQPLFARYGYINSSLWLEGGRATISDSELAALEPGDVVLFDESGLSVRNGHAEGVAELRAGTGENGALKTSIVPEGAVIKCTVIGG